MNNETKGNYSERKCKCGNIFYVPFGKTGQMKLKNTRPRSAKTCSPKCSKIHNDNYSHSKPITNHSQQIKKDDEVTLTTENTHLEPRSEAEEDNKKRDKTVDADNQSVDSLTGSNDKAKLGEEE